MNRTNRALNRIVLFIVGLLLLAVGAVLVTIIVWPAAAEYWTRATEAGRGWMESTVEQSMIGATRISWIAIATLVLTAFLVILMIVALTRIGGGRSRTVLRSTGAQTPLGRVTVQEAFVADALQHCLGHRDEILFSSVTANDIRNQPVMHVSITPRKNTSPRQVVEDVDHLVSNLATLTGQNTATYISVRSGLRAKFARDVRRVA